MSLNGIIGTALAEKLVDLSVDDFIALARAGSLGLPPQKLFEGVQAIASGATYDLPTGGGQPKAIVVQAWSFVKDHGQYHDTYGLSSSRAGELTDLLRSNRDAAVAEIAAVVTAALRKRGSPRPVVVNTNGMPGAPTTDHSARPITSTNRNALKEEIKRSPATYGLYRFVAEDTGRAGAERFAVRLGGGLFAFHQSKQGAIDTARICRRLGRRHEPIIASIAFWLGGKNPVYGDAIPTKVEFTGVLGPNEEVPADPVVRDRTTAGGGE